MSELCMWECLQDLASLKKNLASIRKDPPKALSLLAELRPNPSTVIAQIANVEQAPAAPAQPQPPSFFLRAAQSMGNPNSKSSLQPPRKNSQARPIVQTDAQFPASSSVAQLPPLQAAATAEKLPGAVTRCTS